MKSVYGSAYPEGIKRHALRDDGKAMCGRRISRLLMDSKSKALNHNWFMTNCAQCSHALAAKFRAAKGTKSPGEETL